MLTSSQFVVWATILLMRQKIHLNLTPPVHQSGSFVSAPIGGKVTLHCFHDSERIYWYRQTLGQKPTPIASFYVYGKETIFHGEFKNNSRLDLVKGDRTNHLIISNLRISDSATYFCGTSNAQVVAFAQGTVVSVKSFDSDVKVLIHQLVSESLQPEGSATLNCTVKTGSGGGEHRVYWFKNSDGFQPGFLYTQGSKNDQSERNSNTPTHTCVHRLSMDDPSVSDAGSYHCAVASCGHILFENKNLLKNAVVGTLTGFLTTLLAASLVFLLCRLRKTSGESECINILICFHVFFQVNDQDMTVLYASINVDQSNRSRRQRESSKTECVYSSVSQRK
uniref:Ig-like domain-containing protein n=1 Tax=Poecilia mexicana TaxID=48701 RepID=A0A3B3YCU7_9TELE